MTDQGMSKKEVNRLRCREKVLIWKKSLFILLMIGILVIAGCSKKEDPIVNSNNTADSPQTRTQSVERKPFIVQNQETVIVYFATPDKKNLVPVTLSVKTTKEAAKVAVEKLLAGPENDFSCGVIPEGTKLKDIYLQGRTVYVDLTEDIEKLNEEAESAQLALDALTLTLTEFNEVDDVQVLIDSQVEKELGEINIENPLKRPEQINLYGKPGKHNIKIFFSDSNAMYLVPITIGVEDGDIPLRAMKKLLNGPPENSGLISTVWPGTKINNFTIEDGVATIDFSNEVLGYGGGTTAETMLLNSVVLTLTQFEEIEAVQILIDGKKVEFLPEGSDISAPIPAPRKINQVQ